MIKMKCTIIIMGATGDLSRKKLVPAIYNLIKSKKLSDFAVIGVSRSEWKSEELLNKSKQYIKNIDKKVWNKLKERFFYYRTDFKEKKNVCDIGFFAKNIESRFKLPGNRIFYLAIQPRYFEGVSKGLDKCSLTKENRNWVRVVYEKPFGDNLKSAVDINKSINKIFDESQIFRIDHYLGKEIVQNVSVARFTNTILEPLWNKKYIDHVQIVLTEDFGIDNRGAFYDNYGALKDVMQNHVLQLLSLTAMETPRKLDAKNIRDEKVKVLKAIKRIQQKNVVLGQYNGYQKEEGVRKNSKTETFAAIKLFVDNERWKGVPFYLISGKNMKNKLAAIYVEFKQARCELFGKKSKFTQNYLVMQVQPNEGFYMQLNAKSPSIGEIVPVDMDFCHGCKFGPNTPEAYENLLYDVMKGDQSLFVRSDEIELQWKLIDSIERKKLKVDKYKAKSYPKTAKKLIEDDCRYWHLKAK